MSTLYQHGYSCADDREPTSPSTKSAVADFPRLARSREVALCLAAPAVVLILAFALQYTELDAWLASGFYDEATQTWPLREHWLVQATLHQGAQLTVKALGLLFLAYTVRRMVSKRRTRFPKGLIAAFLAMLMGPLAVGSLKAVSHLPSPWDDLRFGGTVGHLRLLDPVPPGTPRGHAFPSGHASSGFAFMALYFTAALRRPSLRLHCLVGGVMLGLVFGIAQQARGAHFLSHDLFALGICWVSAFGVYLLFYPKRLLRFYLSSAGERRERSPVHSVVAPFSIARANPAFSSDAS